MEYAAEMLFYAPSAERNYINFKYPVYFQQIFGIVAFFYNNLVFCKLIIIN